MMRFCRHIQRRRTTLLSAGFLAALALVTLTHWHFTVVHENLSLLRSRSWCDAAAAAAAATATPAAAPGAPAGATRASGSATSWTSALLCGRSHRSVQASQTLRHGTAASDDGGTDGVRHDSSHERERTTDLAADADMLACHYFQHLDALTNGSSSWELQQPAAVRVLAVLQRLRPRHRCNSTATAAIGASPISNVSTAAIINSTAITSDSTLIANISTVPPTADEATAALGLLLTSVVAVKAQACSPAADSTTSPTATAAGNASGVTDGWSDRDPSGDAAVLLPHPGAFVAVRRLTVAVMLQLWADPNATAWRDALIKVAPDILSAYKAAHACGAARRTAMELFHISKSGGTSVCQLARYGTRRAERFDQGGNCLQQWFDDDPKWTTVPDFAPAKNSLLSRKCVMWAAYDCDEWLAKPEVACAVRQRVLEAQGLDLYSNEHALHGSTQHPGSAHLCPQFESLVVLRDPVLRAEAHIIEIIRVYMGTSRRSCARPGPQRDRNFALPRNLSQWRTLAPSAVDNYAVRSLLGKHFHCKPFGGLTQEHLHHAQLKLLGFDYIAVLADDDHNDIIFRLALGWPETLRTSHLRWGLDYSDAQRRHVNPRNYALLATGSRIEVAGGFPRGSSSLLATWNALDAQLIAVGKAALHLDAAFFATAAVYNKQTRPAASASASARAATKGGGGARTRNATALPNASLVAAAPLSIRRMMDAHRLEWSQQIQHFIHHPEVSVAAEPLPVDPRLLLFGAPARLVAAGAASSSSGSGGIAAIVASLFGGGRNAAPAATAATATAEGDVASYPRLEFVCPDASHGGARKVQSSAKKKTQRVRPWTDAGVLDAAAAKPFIARVGTAKRLVVQRQP